MQEPKILPDQSKTLAATKYVKLYDLAYENGVHYYDASRRDKDQLFAFKQDPELGSALPDAVCAVIIVKSRSERQAPALLRVPVPGWQLPARPTGRLD
ncbi:hypothetical protein LOB88_10165 [Lactobacillus delbrueckii subsp. lactis]|nr:hypothetical protein [Lactobacillus delbrueckii]MCD5597418.1 hypothetical protein [Lactobacillus delbrueckii subsp. lactis]